jgi:hypothetical protein
VLALGALPARFLIPAVLACGLLALVFKNRFFHAVLEDGPWWLWLLD